MISYRMMDSACLLTTCLHKGPIALTQCEAPESVPAYIETISDMPRGSVARVLRELSERYGACGVVAVDGDEVVGKIRFYPQVVCDRVCGCVQQEEPFRSLLALDIGSLPPRDQVSALHILCVQVSQAYAGRGIAGGMLDMLIGWARAEGWRAITAGAGQQIPPLLNWSGMLGCESLRRRGFVVVSQRMDPGVREAIKSQRAGYHGPEVRKQWEAYTGMSDDEAAAIYEMVLTLA